MLLEALSKCSPVHRESASREHNDSGGAALGEASQLLWLYSCKRFWQELRSSAGARYADAVRGCLMGLGHNDTQLEHEGFNNDVYWNVVYPLV